MLDSEEHSAGIFREFAATFTTDDHPRSVWLTGGEPLLRPDLIHEIAKSAHDAGSAVVLITGLYFARADGRIPKRLLEALLDVDHVIASQDVFHEVQVPRSSAFATMRTLVDCGADVSFQVVGKDSHDPYLHDVTGQIRREFADQVPAMVAPLGAAGRAKEWIQLPERHFDATPAAVPCTMAAWPVVTFDGSIVGCCQQSVVDGPAPVHLQLGHAAEDDWPSVRRRLGSSAALRAIRTFGPEHLAEQVGADRAEGYCDTCAGLCHRPEARSNIVQIVDRPSFDFLEEEVQGMQTAAGVESFARMYGISEFAHMITLGLDGRPRSSTADPIGVQP